MNVLVDTSVWSLAFRRRDTDLTPPALELRELIFEGRANILGSVRQEILSGIRSDTQFHRLREALRAFPDLTVDARDYERAAEFFNLCRRAGVQGSNTDLLICAIAGRHNMPILTTDKDFHLFAKHVPVQLHEPRQDFPELGNGL